MLIDQPVHVYGSALPISALRYENENLMFDTPPVIFISKYAKIIVLEGQNIKFLRVVAVESVRSGHCSINFILFHIIFIYYIFIMNLFIIYNK